MSNGLINRQYVGARYVPKIVGEWNKALQYEALSVVTYMGNSFTSKVPVPANIDITNEDYWVNTGNYNAQVDYYRKETQELKERVSIQIASYDNVNSMKNDEKLIEGKTVRTNGYYEVGDNGDGYYIIVSSEPSGVYEKLANGLYAKLEILDSTIRPEQLGAHADGVHDDTVYIQKAIDLSSANKLTVLFNNKYYKTITPLVLKECCSLYGGVTNDEYKHKSVIQNTNSDMFTLENNTVGVVIQNLCFVTIATANTICFNTGKYALEWSKLSNIGIVNYSKAFNASILGTRMYNLWINNGYSMGVLSGSDNIISDCFVNNVAPTASKTTLLSTGGGLSLTRFENVYFTGRQHDDNGCYTIMKIGAYCQNLTFSGCYFDYSYGSAVTIGGGGGDFPSSGACGLVFDKCLFRGNCTDETTDYHVITMEYCRNVTIRGCTFASQNRFTVNSNSKLYACNDYAQGVLLENNYYNAPYSATGSAVQQMSLLETYPRNMNNVGIICNRSRIYADTFKGRTDATYGAVTIPFNYAFNSVPHVAVTMHSSAAVACIQSVSESSAQVVIRRVADGTPIINDNVAVDIIAIGS